MRKRGRARGRKGGRKDPTGHKFTLLSSFPPAEGLIKVFYNSDFTFSQRLYGLLDVDFPRVWLYQPLSELIQLSVLYIRDSIPYKCFRWDISV